MTPLPTTTKRTARIVVDALAHYSLDGDNVQVALEALRELLDTDKVVLYSLEPRPQSDDLQIARHAAVSVPDPGWRTTFDDYLTGRGVAWGAYNAISPEPSQRNRVLDTSQIDVLTQGRQRGIAQVVFKRLGALGNDAMRVLVCDGPSLLAWVGILQPQKTTARQRALFEHVVPAFRKRLAFDRTVSETALASGAVVAALEHVSGAAWLLGPGGRVDHANTAAHARLENDRTGTLAALARCVAGIPEPRFTVMAVRGGGGRAGHVVVEALTRAETHGIPRAVSRLGLTPAQTRVLERIARGASNAAIASELKVAERTVEAHVTAILEKAQVPSRAALIVQIFA
jgi:DNA-binding CsgD family transcriptional regulator